jgi:hypothetical protein
MQMIETEVRVLRHLPNYGVEVEILDDHNAIETYPYRLRNLAGQTYVVRNPEIEVTTTDGRVTFRRTELKLFPINFDRFKDGERATLLSSPHSGFLAGIRQQTVSPAQG